MLNIPKWGFYAFAGILLLFLLLVFLRRAENKKIEIVENKISVNEDSIRYNNALISQKKYYENLIAQCQEVQARTTAQIEEKQKEVLKKRNVKKATINPNPDDAELVSFLSELAANIRTARGLDTIAR